MLHVRVCVVQCVDFSAWTNTAISCGLGGEVIMLHGQDYCACDQLKHKLVGNIEVRFHSSVVKATTLEIGFFRDL